MPCVWRSKVAHVPAEWAPAALVQRLGDCWFKVGEDAEECAVTLPLGLFLHYAATTTDDDPLYVFDEHFEAEAPCLTRMYSPPAELRTVPCMPPPNGAPDRWLLIGGPRSGSALHQDPQGTAAWNAVLSGRKLWAMAPPHLSACDAGVADLPDDCGGMQWFARFSGPLLRHPDSLVFEQAAGEVVYVPPGWWHAVVNLDVTVAVTQNFIVTCLD